MIKKILLTLTAFGIILAAASVAVFAAAFSLFTLLSEYLGVAGAAGVTAGVAVMVVIICSLVLALKFRRPAQKVAESAEGGLTGKLLALAKERPLLTAGAAAAIAAIAFRNPRLVTALLTGILAGKASPKN